MLTDHIAMLIEQMLDEGGGSLELKRNEMASKIGCVPSQISYVITSRFTPERGYVIESRRGGGGCIKIVRKQMQKNEYLMHFFYAIGDSIDEKEATAYLKNLLGNVIINEREYAIARSALCDASLTGLTGDEKNRVRASIFRHVILALMN